MKPLPILIHNRWALGDTVCLSAAVRDLALAHPGRFRVSMAGAYLAHWNHLPYVAPAEAGARPLSVTVEYRDGILASHAGRYRSHFLTWFHHSLGRALKVPIPVTAPRGDIRLSAAEDRRLVTGRYWVVVAGGKTDMTAKWWPAARYQEVVDRLRGRGIACVQAGAHFARHVHPPLRNCVSAVGATDSIRRLYALIRHSDGVICGITGAMHIAAVFEKSCVVLAGGREEVWWEHYGNDIPGQWPAGCPPVAVPHRFLHTLGRLPCCTPRGCWKKRTVPIERSDSDRGRADLCTDPVRGAQPVPRCLDMITVEQVVEAVMSYQQTEAPPEPVRFVAPPPKPPPPNPPPPEVVTPPRAAEDPHYKLLDNPAIGGKFAIFILAYGPYPELLKRCLESITTTTPAGRREVRVALNQPCPETLEYAAARLGDGTIAALYPDHGTRRKYPAMRQMFHDPKRPITTRYVVWFDDDAYVVNHRWLLQLAETIVANHRTGCRLYGAPWYHDLAAYAKGGHRPDLWFRQASWWRGRDLRLKADVNQAAPNGSVCSFVSGWFWCLETAAMRQADIPDARLVHNGGDICIGEQVHQAGFKIRAFNLNKSLVYTPPKDQGGRRGYEESFPWSTPGGGGT